MLDWEGDVGGPMVISYLTSALFTVVFFFVVYRNEMLTGQALTVGTAAFAGLFIFGFARYAKSMWVTFLFETNTIDEYEKVDEMKRNATAKSHAKNSESTD